MDLVGTLQYQLPKPICCLLNTKRCLMPMLPCASAVSNACVKRCVAPQLEEDCEAVLAWCAFASEVREPIMGRRCCRFYWGCDPISYAQRALAINEFAAPRWQNMKLPNGESVGNTILDQRDIPHEQWWIWCAPSALTAPCEASFIVLVSVVSTVKGLSSCGEIMGAQLTCC